GDDPQPRHAAGERRPRDLRGARRRRASDLRAGGYPADGAALFPVLKKVKAMRAMKTRRKGEWRGVVAGRAVLAHDERALRRRVVTLDTGIDVLVDLPHTQALETGDALALEDGRFAEIVAADEDLHAVTGRDALHLAQLCWHIGNRHL